MKTKENTKEGPWGPSYVPCEDAEDVRYVLSDFFRKLIKEYAEELAMYNRSQSKHKEPLNGTEPLRSFRKGIVSAIDYVDSIFKYWEVKNK